MKRICILIAAAVCAMLFVSLPFSASETGSYLRGDADGNGVININDVSLIQRVLAESVQDADGAIAKRGNIDGGVLTISDATMIQMYLAEYGNPCGIGESVQETPTTAERTTEKYELPFIPN